MQNSKDAKPHPPSVIWAQREDKIYLTINLEDCKEPEISFTEDCLSFKGTGGPSTHQERHEVVIEFYEKIDPDKSKYIVRPRHIPMLLERKEHGAYWPRLLKSKDKAHWLRTDFENWKEEHDPDDDKEQQIDFRRMFEKPESNDDDDDDNQAPDEDNEFSSCEPDHSEHDQEDSSMSE